MDMQSRTTEYGAWRPHTHDEIEARRLTPLQAGVKNRGITRQHDHRGTAIDANDPGGLAPDAGAYSIGFGRF